MMRYKRKARWASELAAWAALLATPWAGAQTPAIRVDNSKNVGIGTTTPAAPLHVMRSDGSAKIFVEETAGTAARRLFELKNSGLTGFRMTNTAGPFPWDFFATVQSFEIAEVGDGDGAEFRLLSNGNLQILGSLISGGPSCQAGCDAVFDQSAAVEPIEDHAAAMWAKGFLPAAGPTSPDQPLNVTEKIGGLLNELEKAHIYIDQLNERLKRTAEDKDAEIASLNARVGERDQQLLDLSERLARVEAALLGSASE